MIIAIFPLAIAIIGLLIWILSSNPKVSEAGKILFFCGMLVLTFSFAGEVLQVGGKG